MQACDAIRVRGVEQVIGELVISSYNLIKLDTSSTSEEKILASVIEELIIEAGSKIAESC